jgi:hypothetical protein
MNFPKGGHKMVAPTLFPGKQLSSWNSFFEEKGTKLPQNQVFECLTRKFKGELCPNERFFMLLNFLSSVDI